MRVARALALLGLSLTVAPSSVAGAPATRPAFGLDHLVHEGRVSVAGGSPLPCSRCHTMDKTGALVGAPDHRSCYGACHGSAPTRSSPAKRRKIAAPERRVCTRCHTPVSIEQWKRGSTAKLQAFYRPYSIQHDYGINLSHSKHDAPSRTGGRHARGCRTCHGVPGTPAPSPSSTPHARCASCHLAPAKNAPPMTACASCHRAAYGPASRPNLTSSAFSVGKNFSHTKHLARLDAGKDCRTCHATVASATGIDLAPPKSEVCATCHDGNKAFSTDAPTCRTCHAKRDPKAPRMSAPTKRYSHRLHQRRGISQTCKTCHQLDGAGEPRTASRDHSPCSNAGCHASEFRAKKPTICGSCHIAIEPWRSLHHDRGPRHITEFGARFSHRAHLSGRPPRVAASCASCHKRRATGRERALPRGHTSCSGGACHGDSTGAKPHLEQCGACHALGIQGQRTRARQLAKWSVRARFRHDQHAAKALVPANPRKSVACKTCHQGMVQARGLTAAPTPAKATCATCHTGKAAFKLTGHRCWRCHSQRTATHRNPR